jgi:hypothetical protein
VTVATNVTLGGDTHQYIREPTTTANGWYAIRVPYNGTYTAGDRQYEVSQNAVQTGGFTANQSTTAYWPLNASRGKVAFDVRGGNHGRIVGADWTPAGTGLSFADGDRVTVPNAERLGTQSTFTLTTTFKTSADTNYTADIRYPRIATTAASGSFRNTSGVQLALSRGNIIAAVGNGSTAAVLRGPRVDDSERHTVSLLRDGESLQLQVDTETVANTTYDGRIEPRETFSIGATSSGRAGFVGQINAVSMTAEPRNKTKATN